MLLDRSNTAVMIRYVSSLDNMRVFMNLLRVCSLPYYFSDCCIYNSHDYVTQKGFFNFRILTSQFSLQPFKCLRYWQSIHYAYILLNWVFYLALNLNILIFGVKQLFVANENKPLEIVGILISNRTKLLRFFADFNNDKGGEDFLSPLAILCLSLFLNCYMRGCSTPFCRGRDFPRR